MKYFLLIWIIALILICSYESTARIQHVYQQERLVTDIALIENFRGVPRYFGYNETVNGNNQLVSSPGCPKSIDAYPWIYYKYDGECRCYLAGTQGPCPHGQALFVKSGTPCGMCACDCFLNGPNFEEADHIYQQCFSKSSPHGQVYDKRDKSVCYNLNERGPCPDGKVVRIGENGKTLNCVKVCGENEVADCIALAQGRVFIASAVASFIESDCPPEEKFSRILRKCVKLQPKSDLVLG